MPYAERVWFQGALLLLAFIPLTIVAAQFDARTLNDIGIWAKPMKFHVSTALHLLTFAMLLRYLPEKTRTATWLNIIAAVSVCATVIEIFLIDSQAWRGVASHFNLSTQFDGLIYTMMGIAALFLTMPALIVGIMFLLSPLSEKLTLGLKWGTSIGLILGFILTLLIAGYMSSLPGGHWIDAPRTDAGGLVIVGWSRSGGDLRVPHFFATHLMQLLPLTGLILDKALRHRTASIRWGVILTTVVGVGITIATLLQALAGQAFIS